MRLVWKKRCRKRTIQTANVREWWSKDNRYLVSESNSLYGLPTVIRAIHVDGAGQQWIISRHRKRGPATAACDKHARLNTE